MNHSLQSVHVAKHILHGAGVVRRAEISLVELLSNELPDTHLTLAIMWEHLIRRAVSCWGTFSSRAGWTDLIWRLLRLLP